MIFYRTKFYTGIQCKKSAFNANTLKNFNKCSMIGVDINGEMTMVDKLLDRLVNAMREYGIVKDDDSYEIVRFGAEILIMKILFLFITILVGFLTSSLIEIIIFMLTFQPLRMYCGGYHAETKISCAVSSVLMMISVVVLNKVISATILPMFPVIAILVSSIIILYFAPLGSPNKPLDEDEKTVYKKRARFILIIILIVAVIAFVTQVYRYLFMLALGLLAVSFLLILGKIKG